MNLFAREDILNSYLEKGIRFSAQGIELPYYFFGTGSLFILPIIQSFMYALITNLYLFRIRSNRTVEAIMMVLILNIMMTVMSQGDIYLLFANRVLLSVAIMIVIWISIKEGIFRQRKGQYDKKGKELAAQVTK